ncbi:unnamed protein product [Paramecium pentaurelia]|uniref:Uncharacterized protein n=1 Tax=Paramecium pentaurelia TaxID=43138 RepID=A0A8S1W7B9_9CILI|nr:unnamed protein product [Paramecium pentaurelia]
MDQQIKKEDDEFQIDEIKYQVSSAKVDGKEYYLYEYKKELNKDENDKLNQFLQKLEIGLKGEEGMEGVMSICKGWKKECEQKQFQ